MLESIYVAMSGLISFENGLKNISNNVANLNTPGFKATDLEFSDLLYQTQNSGANNGGQSGLTLGSGVTTPLTTTDFSQGTLSQTGNNLNAAINGNGFFVVRQDGNSFYTRDGQFQIDGSGFLTTLSGARVQGLVNGALQDINVSGNSAIPGKATSTVNFTNNLSTNSTSPTFTVSGISVFDSSGASHTLSATFTNNTSTTAGSWTFTVTDTATGNIVASNGQVIFGGDGSPQAGNNTFTFGYSPTGVAPLAITFNFGAPGSFSGATSFSGGSTSTLSVASQDGFASGSLTGTTFDTKGTLVLNYSNGQTVNGPQLALAAFNNLQNLAPDGASLFTNPNGQTVQLGTAQTLAFGQIVGGSIESANVDLAKEFSDLIILQRGYQASSEAMSTANELIQTLLDVKGKQG